MREFSNSREMLDHYAAIRSKFFPPPPPPRYKPHNVVPVSVARTVAFVGHEFQTVVQFKRKARDKIQPLALLLIHEYNGLSLSRIGRILGRHHTSILYAVRSARHLIRSDPSFAERYNRILNRLDQP